MYTHFVKLPQNPQVPEDREQKSEDRYHLNLRCFEIQLDLLMIEAEKRWIKKFIQQMEVQDAEN